MVADGLGDLPAPCQVNLMQYMKLSTSRDFRINAAVLETALQESEEVGPCST